MKRKRKGMIPETPSTMQGRIPSGPPLPVHVGQHPKPLHHHPRSIPLPEGAEEHNLYSPKGTVAGTMTTIVTRADEVDLLPEVRMNVGIITLATDRNNADLPMPGHCHRRIAAEDEADVGATIEGSWFRILYRTALRGRATHKGEYNSAFASKLDYQIQYGKSVVLSFYFLFHGMSLSLYNIYMMYCIWTLVRVDSSENVKICRV